MRLPHKALSATVAALALAACDTLPLDFDLRGANGGFSTAQAARDATANRPAPDNRGVISYPNYQVAVARRGDTLNDVANRVGLDAASLARFNGIAVDTALRAGEVVALPSRVAEPSPATGAATTGPIRPAPVDVTTLADAAIENAPDTTPPAAASPAPQPSLPQTGEEPIRHRVERGETAFTIARLYSVPVRALAEWNGLGSGFAIREGQFLLIPVTRQAPPRAEATTAPGEGSATPTPPSASKPLPEDDTAEEVAAPVKPDVGPTTRPAPQETAAMAYPVQGSVVRAYKTGRNDGIDIKAEPGSPVSAAAAGTVAAITRSSEGVGIVVVRHPNNLLTVYANVDDVSVKKGDAVARGAPIAKLRGGDNAVLQFEVRDGFDSVDPALYLEG